TTRDSASGSQLARVTVSGTTRTVVEKVASDLGFDISAAPSPKAPATGSIAVHAPRIAMYDTWNGGNMDEGWTRWTLEQYGFHSTRLHNAEVRAGKLHEKYDVVILPDQAVRSIVD